MTEFKKGDVVKRVGDSYQDVVAGQTYVVQDAGSASVKLQGCSGSYDPAMFELVGGKLPGIDLNKDGWHIPISSQEELEAAYEWLASNGCTARHMSCGWPLYSEYITNVSVAIQPEGRVENKIMHGKGRELGHKITLNFRKVVEVASYVVEVSETPAQKKLRELEESAALIQQQIAELKAQL